MIKYNKSIEENIFNLDEDIKITLHDIDKNEPNEDWINDKISAGNLGILKALSYKKNRIYKYNLFLINMYTIARNLSSYFNNKISQIDASKILELYKNDINMILEYINIYRKLTLSEYFSTKKYMVIFYFPNYYKFPYRDKLFRPINNQNTKMNLEIYNILLKSIKKIKIDTLFKITDNQYYTFLNPNVYSNLALYRIISSYINYYKNIILISHIPLDYHLIKLIPTIHILESYTGKILNKKNMISMKIFKTDTVPWNKYSHYLLGDKYLIKPKLYRNKKKELIILSSKYNMKLMSDNQFKKSLVNLGLLNLEEFNFHPY